MASMDIPALVTPPVKVTIGAALGYMAPHSLPALFLVQPHPESGHIVLHESFVASSGMPVVPAVDQHGNRVIRIMLVPGYNEFRYEAALSIGEERKAGPAGIEQIQALSMDVLRYTFPSRYCESDKLYDFAQTRFCQIDDGMDRVQAICDWTHRNLAYRHGSGNASISGCDAIQRGYGVCRDFAHVMISLCRAMDIPARYVAGHIPMLAQNKVDYENDIGIDFHAYVEAYLDGQWHTFDPRYNRDFTGRIKLAHGMDAVDAAFATFYGNVQFAGFEVWAKPAMSPDEHAAPSPYLCIA